MRKKALWIPGKIGERFHDLMGVHRQAEHQGKKILGSNDVHVLDIISKPEFGGYLVLVCSGSDRRGGRRRDGEHHK